MSSDLLVLLLLVLVVLLGSALCSGVEAALLTVSPIRVHELAARERPVAGAGGWRSCVNGWGAPCRLW